MIDSGLLEYVKTQIKNGYTVDQIKKVLLESGRTQEDIDSAFLEINSKVPSSSSPLNVNQAPVATIITSTNASSQAVNQPVQDNNTKTIVTVILLLLVYPIGVIVMWVWSKWKTWVKILLSLPILIGIGILIFSLVMGGFFFATNKDKIKVTNPSSQTEETGKAGSPCVISSDCESKKCVSTETDRVCTDGNVGDPCFIDMDCQTNICVEDVCTEGKVGDKCTMSFDCQEQLSCNLGVCE